MPLHYIGRTSGFPSCTYAEIFSSEFVTPVLNDIPNKKRSPVTQFHILQDLKEFNNDVPRPCDPLMDLAISHTARRFRLPTPVKILHLNDVFKMDSDIWTKSPGLPWTTYGVKTKGQIRDDPSKVRDVRKFWHLIKNGDDIRFPDCCAFVPYVLDKHKVRAVWGYPATVTFGEAVFARLLIEAYQKLPYENTPIAYGFETATGGMIKIRNRFSRDGLHYTGLDFTKFDKTVPEWLIRIAFNILEINIDFAHYEDHGIPDASKINYMYSRIVDYFINTPVRTARGLRFRKSSGIASGSYFTQLIGSVVNCILITYACLKAIGRMPVDAVFLGDNSLISTSCKIALEDISQALSCVGMRINEKKSQVTSQLDEIKFLGYTISHGQPRKAKEDLLASLVFPEHPDEDWDI